MEVGPDGLLYFPVMGTGEIWRIDPTAAAAPKSWRQGLGVPDAVKFDAQGHLVSTQVHSGQVLRIDPGTGEQTVLANLSPGLDNLTSWARRLFVSNFTGEITEVLDGLQTRAVLPGGLNWPLDLTVGPRRRVVCRRRHLLLRAAGRRQPAYPRHAVQPRLSRLRARAWPRPGQASSW